MATRGEYLALGSELTRQRRAGVAMNTPIDTGKPQSETLE
jgi:hypothetical protein